MVNNLPTTFRRGTNINANYDYVDVASGLGYQLYYLRTVRDESLTEKYLIDSNGSGKGMVPYKAINAPASSFTAFSNPFRYPRHVKGNVIIQVAVDSGNNGQDMNVDLYHCDKDGVTLTELGSLDNWDVDSTSEVAVFIFEDIDKNFKRGDMIAIKFTGGTSVSAGFYVGTSPEGTMLGGHSANTILHIPFKISL